MAKLSADRQRAVDLLRAGVVGGHVACAVAVALFYVFRGTPAAVTCLAGGAVTLAFYLIGQSVQVAMADSSPTKVLAASMISYLSRVSVLGLMLAAAQVQPGRLAGFDKLALISGTLAVVVGWLSACIAVFSRMRILVFDEPSRTGDHCGAP